MTGTESEAEKAVQLDEIPLSKELSVYAAIGGIGLSHSSIPGFGMANPIDDLMILFSVGLIISIVATYVDERFKTVRFGLSASRTISLLLFIYLVSNGVRGLSAYAGVLNSGNSKSIATVCFLLISLILLSIKRWEIGGFSDWRAAKKVEHESDWSLRERLREISVKTGLVIIPYLFPAFINPDRFLIPTLCGLISASLGSIFLGKIFFRRGELDEPDSGKAKAVIAFPGSVVLFLILFGGINPPL